MQKYNATVIMTTGASGTGKTYSRCARFLWDLWLPEEKGVHWSNFPVNFERFEAKYPDVRERVQIIPADVLKSWTACDGSAGPWDFFADEDLQGAHISFDEAHNFLKRKGKGINKNVEMWERWLGEIRHRGATVEFLSQDPHKLNATVEQHAGVRIQLVSSEDRRDPLFSILLGDWYEGRAAFTGVYENVIWQIEERRIAGKWKQSNFERFTLQPEYFVLYDSHNTPQSGGVKADGHERQFQKRGRFGVVFWFIRRNVFRLLSRLLLVFAVMWLCFGGGIPWVIGHFNSYVRGMAGAKTVPSPEGVKVSNAQSNLDRALEFARIKRLPDASAVPVVPPPAPPPVLPAPMLPTLSTNGNLGPEYVRSETYQHGTLERPVSGEVQQTYVPRVVFISPMFIAMDDGLMVSKGERVGGFVLLRIDYFRRVCLFGGVGNEASLPVLSVPVGGPLTRVRRAAPISERSEESGGGSSIVGKVLSGKSGAAHR